MVIHRVEDATIGRGDLCIVETPAPQEDLLSQAKLLIARHLPAALPQEPTTAIFRAKTKKGSGWHLGKVRGTHYSDIPLDYFGEDNTTLIEQELANEGATGNDVRRTFLRQYYDGYGRMGVIARTLHELGHQTTAEVFGAESMYGFSSDALVTDDELSALSGPVALVDLLEERMPNIGNHLTKSITEGLADVVKHMVLSGMIEEEKQKDPPWRDT